MGLDLQLSVPLDQLWQILPPNDQQHLLKTLSQLVAKQFQAPPGEKEGSHDNC
jgi:hypothetical protein